MPPPCPQGQALFKEPSAAEGGAATAGPPAMAGLLALVMAPCLVAGSPPPLPRLDGSPVGGAQGGAQGGGAQGQPPEPEPEPEPEPSW